MTCLFNHYLLQVTNLIYSELEIVNVLPLTLSRSTLLNILMSVALSIFSLNSPFVSCTFSALRLTKRYRLDRMIRPGHNRHEGRLWDFEEKNSSCPKYML